MIGNNGSESLIVITGDIMHTKTEQSPEAFYIGKNFLRNLIDIATVIVMAGNHDCNLSNKKRMDAIFPMIEDGEYNDITDYNNNDEPYITKKGKIYNLYYLRKTGFYRLHNIFFGLTNIFDTDLLVADNLDDNKFNNIKQTKKYKIALFHGTIDKAETDRRFTLNNEHLNAGDFKGYDYVMLGDIHKFQYMNKSKTIAYAGSLIQQTYGETLKNHGLIKWHLSKKKSKHIEIHNDYGYCTISIVDGEMIKTEIPKKPRIRFMLDNTTLVEYNKIRKKIEKEYDINEIDKDTIAKTKLLYNNVHNFVNDINDGRTSDVMHINKIKEYLKLELLLFGYIDPQYISEAEIKIKHIFEDMELKLDHEKYNEITIIPKNKMRTIKEQY